MRRDLPWYWQFLKYAACGGMSAALLLGIVLLVRMWWPELVDVDALTQSELIRNTNLISTAAFIPSTVVAYLLNRAFVFTPGQLSPRMEFAAFMVIALISYILGLVGTDVLMRQYGASSLIGNLTFGIPSILVNFLCRKFLIFKR